MPPSAPPPALTWRRTCAPRQAKAEGHLVELVVVDDDVAIPPPTGLAGRRGLAGTIFVHKIAGAAAAEGRNLKEVKAAAEAAIASLGTLGVSLSGQPTLPGQSRASDRLGDAEMELGLGIHGEPGRAVMGLLPADELAGLMLGKIAEETGYLPLQKGERVALLINSLGAATALELSVVANSALAFCRNSLGLEVARVSHGAFVTSLDMHGLSLTLFRIADEEQLRRLDAPTEAPAWVPPTEPVPAVRSRIPLANAPAEPGNTPPDVASSPSSLKVKAAIAAACEALLAKEDDLNAMDAKVGDGDCGATLARGARRILEVDLAFNNPAKLAKQIGLAVRGSMGGTSGALFDIFFHAAATSQGLRGAASSEDLGLAALAGAFADGVNAIRRYGGASVGDRTMLDALLPAAEALLAGAAENTTAAEALARAAAAARQGAERTTGMGAQAGRSSYVAPAVLAEVPDPGAVAAACWLGAVASALGSLEHS